MIGAFAFAIFTHGLYDVLLFLGGWTKWISVLFLFFGTCPLAYWFVHRFLPYKPPSGDIEIQNEQNIQSQWQDFHAQQGTYATGTTCVDPPSAPPAYNTIEA